MLPQQVIYQNINLNTTEVKVEEQVDTEKKITKMDDYKLFLGTQN